MNKDEILNKCRKYNSSNDMLYYLICKKEYDVFAVIGVPCNYLYQNDADQFFGTCLYVSENNISDAMRSEFTYKKRLFGLDMVKTTVKTDGKNRLSLDNQQIRDLPFRYRIDSVPRFQSPFIPAYSCFECEDVIEIIEPRTALINLCNKDEDFKSFISKLSKQFDVCTEQMGIAGSAALGAESPNDYDIVFYGNTYELWKINNSVAEINKKQGIPKVSGLPLPFSFNFGDRTVDTFYVYNDLPLHNIHTAQQIETNVSFTCRVTDDIAALQVEPFFKVDSKYYSFLIIMETFFHAVIKKGNLIEGKGDVLSWENNGNKGYVMICKDPFKQIKNYTEYYYQYEQTD